MSHDLHIPTKPELDHARDLVDRPPAAYPLMEHAGSEPQFWRFVRLLLGSLILLVAILMAFNWWVDPTGLLGRRTQGALAENAGVLSIKLDIADAHADNAPDQIWLGSSRMMKVDPADVQDIAGQSALNLGISGGMFRDSRLFAAYAAQLWPQRHGSDSDKAFPHLIIAASNEMARPNNKLLPVHDRRVAAYLDDESLWQQAKDIAKETSQLTTLRLSVKVMRERLHEDGFSGLGRPLDAKISREDQARPANNPENFSDDGMQLFDIRKLSSPHKPRVLTHVKNYVQRTMTDEYEGSSDTGIENLRRLIQLANEKGDVPVVWIVPFEEQYGLPNLPAVHWQRDRAFRSSMRVLQQDEDLDFLVLDYARLKAFGGTNKDFFDAIHMSEANTRRVVEQMQRDGAFGSPDELRELADRQALIDADIKP